MVLAMLREVEVVDRKKDEDVEVVLVLVEEELLVVVVSVPWEDWATFALLMFALHWAGRGDGFCCGQPWDFSGARGGGGG